MAFLRAGGLRVDVDGGDRDPPEDKLIACAELRFGDPVRATVDTPREVADEEAMQRLSLPVALAAVLAGCASTGTLTPTSPLAQPLSAISTLCLDVTPAAVEQTDAVEFVRRQLAPALQDELGAEKVTTCADLPDAAYRLEVVIDSFDRGKQGIVDSRFPSIQLTASLKREKSEELAAFVVVAEGRDGAATANFKGASIRENLTIKAIRNAAELIADYLQGE
ncbi:MAG: hypothetical protein AAGA56_23905 [Myxococcota bacterium]